MSRPQLASVTDEEVLLLTVTEAGRRLGVSRRTAYQLVNSGRLRAVRLEPRPGTGTGEGEMRVRVDDLRAYAQGLPAASKPHQNARDSRTPHPPTRTSRRRVTHMSQTATNPARGVTAPPPFHRVMEFLARFSDKLILTGGHGADVTGLIYDQATATAIVQVSTPAAAAAMAHACGFGDRYCDEASMGRVYRSWLGRYGKATPLRVELRAALVEALPATVTRVPEVPARDLGHDTDGAA